MEELVLGPVNGYYIATYAHAAPDELAGFRSYFKLFTAKPDSYFEGLCVLKGSTALGSDSLANALLAAELEARDTVAHLPPATQLPAVYQRRTLNQYEVRQLGRRS